MEAGILYPVGLSGMKLQKNRVFPHFCRRNNSPEKSLPNKLVLEKTLKCSKQLLNRPAERPQPLE
jgi:hypothetical protein